MSAGAIIASMAAAGISSYAQGRAGNAQQQALVASGNAERLAGEATFRAAESQAQLDEYNAAVADLQAKDAEERGVLEANRFRAKVKQVIGTERVGYAAGNIDVGYGSAVDVQADAAFLGELDALTAKTNAAREAWGYKVQGEDLRRQAAITRQEGGNAELIGRLRQQAGFAQGKAARTAGYLGGATTLLSTSASLLAARYGFRG